MFCFQNEVKYCILRFSLKIDDQYKFQSVEFGFFKIFLLNLGKGLGNRFRDVIILEVGEEGNRD